jgi:hypothetical protein
LPNGENGDCEGMRAKVPACLTKLLWLPDVALDEEEFPWLDLGFCRATTSLTSELEEKLAEGLEAGRRGVLEEELENEVPEETEVMLADCDDVA